jgi:pyroglutamyl-peptidase
MAGRAVLLTGFEPYGGRGVNPAAEILKQLDGTELGGLPVIGRALPVDYRGLKARIDGLLDDFDPAVVVSLGLWPGEAVIRLERLAINVADFEIADNEGLLLTDVAVEGNGPAALPATLPLRSVEQALLDAGIPARISNTAGTFLCNATMFGFLQALAARGRTVPCGFVHLPYMPSQVADLMRQTRKERMLELHQRADLASMDLAVMLRAVEIVIRVCASRRANPQ